MAGLGPRGSTIPSLAFETLCTNTNIYLSINSARYLNALSQCDTYMRQYPRSLLVRIMACRLFGAKPLSAQITVYCQLKLLIDIWGQYESNKQVSLKKNNSKASHKRVASFFPASLNLAVNALAVEVSLFKDSLKQQHKCVPTYSIAGSERIKMPQRIYNHPLSIDMHLTPLTVCSAWLVQ